LSSQKALRLRFASFVFDPLARELVRNGTRVHLSPKAFRFLELLLKDAPRAFSKAEIYEALWPGTFVSEASLTRLVAELRAALQDDARQPALLRTVYGYGYAFSGAVSPEPSGPAPARRQAEAFSVVAGPKEFPLWEGENVIGRTASCAVPVESTSVSRRHARILVEAGRALLEDLGSKNGTYLRGRRLEEPAELAPGDEVRVGPVVLVFRSAAGSDDDSTTEGPVPAE
jgi:DNA-binding winged helix-turn-helix (wHTH) protein